MQPDEVIEKTDQVDSLRMEIAELNSKIDTLLSKNNQPDINQDSSIFQKSEPTELKAKTEDLKQEETQESPTKKETPPQKEKPTEKKKELLTPPMPANLKGDTLFHYYTNGNVSVIRTPFINGHAKWIFYDLQGNATCELKEIDLSFTVSVNLTFHENGAAKQAKIHDNPGASLHFYVSTVSFDTNNQPGWMTTESYPPSLEDHMKPPFYWDKKTWGWRQQEIVREQDTPH